MLSIEEIPASLTLPQNAQALTGIMRGVEREGLRVNSEGRIAHSTHPEALGSALTHPYITTDFSEALLEFITPPSHRVEDLFKQLYATHQFTQKHIADEIIWTCSMPCVLNDDATIPVAQYGESNNAKMKTVYRVGLGNRYGRAMQTVAGLHYNFSLPDAFWSLLKIQHPTISDLQDFKDEQYFGLIRNFRRYYWLLIYLFGASPALCASFIKGRDHDLEPFQGDKRTLYRPFATSLRMGDLGYQSSAQESLNVCYNTKHSYIKSLCAALKHPIGEYHDIGLQQADGSYAQLNTSILQIENEFYSAIRPKRSAKVGETALTALCQRGVEYIEVRCLDINPFDPLGLSKEQVHFLDTFLVFCALKESPETSNEESAAILRNQKRVVNEGRNPKLHLEIYDGNAPKSNRPLKDLAEELLNAMRPVAKMLDSAFGNKAHDASLNQMCKRIGDAQHTPSARMLTALAEKDLPYARYALALSKEHAKTLKSKPYDKKIDALYKELASQSLTKQQSLETSSSGSFDIFLENYYKQYDKCCAKHKDETKNNAQ